MVPLLQATRQATRQPTVHAHAHPLGGEGDSYVCGGKVRSFRVWQERKPAILCNCSFSLRFPQASSEIYFVLPFCCGPVAVEWILLFAHTTKQFQRMSRP